MSTEEILRREHNERAAFSRVGASGRSALSDAELLLPAATIERYRAALRGERALTALERMMAWVAPLEGKRVLEICCHTGEYGALLAKLGATVDAVDIAAPLVARAQRRAEINGVAGRLRPAVMSVHALAFPDASFDVVFGKASLHHLDLAAAQREILRVLRPGGVAVFAEPVAPPGWLAAIRRLVPVPADADSPDERALSADDLASFCAPFRAERRVELRLLERLDRVVPRASGPLARLDTLLLRELPSLRRYAATRVFALTR